MEGCFFVMKNIIESRKVHIVLLLVVVFLSFFVLSYVFSSPALYNDTLRVIDGQKDRAIALNVLVTGSSTALSAIPDDTGTPIAEELAELSQPLMFIVCVLYLEKFLLTTFGLITFKALIPAACLLAIINYYYDKDEVRNWIKKLIILSIALTQIIPCSTLVTEMVEQTFSETVQQTFAAAQDAVEDDDVNEDSNVFVEFFEGIKDNVVGFVDTAKNVLSTMIDAVAVLLITSCVIPLITATVFIWMIKNIFSSNISVNGLIQKMPKRKKTKANGLSELDE